MDRPKVFDHQGRERDWDWLTATFGAIKVERVKLPAGLTKAYRLVKVQDMQGPGVQVVHVADQEGKPLEGVRVARYWPDAPQLPAWPRPTSMWRRRGVYGRTNVNGDIGFGMGQGDYYYKPGVGACSVWVADESGPSDLISGLGMIGGTPHRHIDIYFQLQETEAAPNGEPPPAPPQDPREGPPDQHEAGPPLIGPGQLPAQPPDERWQMILDKLDLIIALLEKRVG